MLKQKNMPPKQQAYQSGVNASIERARLSVKRLPVVSVKGDGLTQFCGADARKTARFDYSSTPMMNRTA